MKNPLAVFFFLPVSKWSTTEASHRNMITVADESTLAIPFLAISLIIVYLSITWYGSGDPLVSSLAVVYVGPR